MIASCPSPERPPSRSEPVIDTTVDKHRNAGKNQIAAEIVIVEDGASKLRQARRRDSLHRHDGRIAVVKTA